MCPASRSELMLRVAKPVTHDCVWFPKYNAVDFTPTLASSYLSWTITFKIITFHYSYITRLNVNNNNLYRNNHINNIEKDQPDAHRLCRILKSSKYKQGKVGQSQEFGCSLSMQPSLVEHPNLLSNPGTLEAAPTYFVISCCKLCFIDIIENYEYLEQSPILGEG